MIIPKSSFCETSSIGGLCEGAVTVILIEQIWGTVLLHEQVEFAVVVVVESKSALAECR